jgi:hypothetical protein
LYTLPAKIRDIAYQNKAVIYDLLFKASDTTTRHNSFAKSAGRNHGVIFGYFAKSSMETGWVLGMETLQGRHNLS